MKNILTYVTLTNIIGGVILIALLIFAPAFAAFGETIIYMGIAIALYASYDKYVLKDIDTIEELKKGNVAYAIKLLAFAVLFLAVAILVG